MKGLVISSGNIKDYDLLKNLVHEHDYIICADGGINHLVKINKKPNVVLGDLDSVTEEGLDFIKNQKVSVEKYPKMKNNTDTELALFHLIKKDIDEITLVGVTGSRIDHTLANLLLLKSLHQKGIKAKIVDQQNIVRYVNNNLKLKKKKESYISVVPLGEKGIIVSLIGFLYPLDKHYIGFGETIGISNEVVEEYGTVIIHKGEALVIESKD